MVSYVRVSGKLPFSQNETTWPGRALRGVRKVWVGLEQGFAGLGVIQGGVKVKILSVAGFAVPTLCKVRKGLIG